MQYTAGAEGWNCVETDTIIFFSENYSYKIMEQACGRIDRLNTPFKNLYYYHMRTDSPIDKAIQKCLSTKKHFYWRDDMKVKTNLSWWILLIALIIRTFAMEDYISCMDAIILLVSILISAGIEKGD